MSRHWSRWGTCGGPSLDRGKGQSKSYAQLPSRRSRRAGRHRRRGGRAQWFLLGGDPSSRTDWRRWRSIGKHSGQRNWCSQYSQSQRRTGRRRKAGNKGSESTQENFTDFRRKSDWAKLTLRHANLNEFKNSCSWRLPPDPIRRTQNSFQLKSSSSPSPDSETSIFTKMRSVVNRLGIKKTSKLRQR